MRKSHTGRRDRRASDGKKATSCAARLGTTQAQPAHLLFQAADLTYTGPFTRTRSYSIHESKYKHISILFAQGLSLVICLTLLCAIIHFCGAPDFGLDTGRAPDCLLRSCLIQEPSSCCCCRSVALAAHAVSLHRSSSPIVHFESSCPVAMLRVHL